MKAKFTIEIEATKDEIDLFTQNVNRFIYRNNDFHMDIKPLGGYIPHFYLPKRKKRMKFNQRTKHDKKEVKIYGKM